MKPKNRMSSACRFRLSSREGIASIGFFVSISGITLTSIVWGSQSTQYYISLAIGFVLALRIVQQALISRRKVVVNVTLLALLPVFFYLMQKVFLNAPEFAQPSIIFTFAVGVTILFALIIALLSEYYFRWTMYLVACAHFIICFYALLNSHMIIAQVDQQRFDALGVHTAVWAELGVGMAAVAVLSARKIIIIASVIVGAIVIFKAQMRGAALSLFILMVIYILMNAYGTRYFLMLSICSIFIFAIFLAFNFEYIVAFINNILLLDDPHRGISAGFSGRFDNWYAGVGRFMKSPVIGVGVSDKIAGYTHNGYLKMLAQFGVFLFLVFCWCLITAMSRAWGARKADFLAVIACYSFFLISTPRYINLQIMPFIGLVAVAFALTNLSGKVTTQAPPTELC